MGTSDIAELKVDELQPADAIAALARQANQMRGVLVDMETQLASLQRKVAAIEQSMRYQ